MEGSRFSFKFVSSLSIRCEKENVSKGSSNIKSPNIKSPCISTKMQQKIQIILMIDASNMLSHLHKTVKKSKIILSEYQILYHFLVYIIGMV